MDTMLLPVLPAERAAGADDFLCVRCSRMQATCCQTAQVYITPADMRRVAVHTGRDDFYEYALPDDPVYLQQDDDPTWPRYVFQPDGTRRVLKRLEQGAGKGDCIFLGQAGCSLPGDVRPLICRMYPFDFNDQGITDKLGDHCPRELLPAGQDLLTALGMDREAAETTRQQIYQEIREEVQFHADRAHLRPAG